MTEAMEGVVIGGAIGGGFGLLGTCIGQWLAYRNNKKLMLDNQKAAERANLDALVLKMIELSIQYPTLEKREYISCYPNCTGDANGKERYENYCVFVFNLLGRIYRHFGGDKEKIEDYIHIREILISHCAWWLHDKENLEYDGPFRQYLQTIIDQARREGKLK